MGQLKRIVQNLFAFTTEKWGKITMISLKSIKSVKIKGNVCSKITVVLKHQLCPKVQSHLLSVKPTNNSSSQTIRLYNHMLFPSPQKVQTMICLTNLSWEITTVFISVCCQNLMGLADSVGVFASKISTPLRKFHTFWFLQDHHFAWQHQVFVSKPLKKTMYYVHCLIQRESLCLNPCDS